MEIMSSNTVSVTLGVGSGPYQKTLAASLLREGMLRRVLRSRDDECVRPYVIRFRPWAA
jgi:hypothetical protein